MVGKVFVTDEGGVGMMRSGPTLRVEGDQLDKIMKRDPADTPEGVHAWVVMTVHRVSIDSWFGGEHHLDLESLITVEGPGCFKCEAQYTPDVDMLCPGQPPGVLGYS